MISSAAHPSPLAAVQLPASFLAARSSPWTAAPSSPAPRAGRKWAAPGIFGALHPSWSLAVAARPSTSARVSFLSPPQPRWTSLPTLPLVSAQRRGLRFVCSYDAGEKDSKSRWPICERFVLIGLAEASVLPYLGFQGRELSLDEKAELLFAGQFAVTAAVLAVIYSITNSFQPLPDDVFCYDLRKPFSLQNGWLLWAGIGFVCALIAIALTGASSAIFSGESPQRETDALVKLLPLIGSSSSSTAFLVGITGVLAPVLEETVFRGFLMVSLTKWFPTPVAVVVTAAVFAFAHLTPSEFPQLFVLGTVLGISYAQTRNLLTPIIIHALWNSGVIVLLTFLQLQGYDIRELVQGSP